MKVLLQEAQFLMNKVMLFCAKQKVAEDEYLLLVHINRFHLLLHAQQFVCHQES